MGPALPTMQRTSAKFRGGAKWEFFLGGGVGEEDTASLTEPKGRSTAGIPRGQDQRPESHQQTAMSEVSLLPSASSSFILSAEQHPCFPHLWPIRMAPNSP